LKKRPYRGLICEYSLDELRRVFNRKFPHKVHVFERFVSEAVLITEIVPVPPHEHPNEHKIRDIKDRPILRAAIEARADIILTGDKDFLESTITQPRILSPADFIKL